MKQILNIIIKMERATFMALINYEIGKWNKKSHFKSILGVNKIGRKRKSIKIDEIDFLMVPCLQN